MDGQTKAKPFLKWAGGKSRVVKQILELFPENFNSYYEPFLGSAAMYFAVSPQHGRLNDSNTALIATYITLRDHPHKLISELESLQSEYYSLPSIEAKKDYYLRRRHEFNSTNRKSVRKSALFIFLNKTGFNGMYRENSKGEYNIPFGRHEKPLICDKDNLLIVSVDLQDIDLTSTSYENAFKDAKKGDLIYLDPPYYPLSKTSNFTEYQAGGFGIKDQIKLRDVFNELSQKGCYVIMSNSACTEIRELYFHYNISEIQVARAINSKAGKRGKIKEYVIKNYA